MGRKNVIVPFKVFEDLDLSQTYTQSEPTNIQYLDNIGIQIVTDGVTDNTGQFSVEVSIDKVAWQALELDPAIAPLNDDDAQIFLNLNQIPFVWLRLTFEPDGGTPDGTATAHLTAKMLG